MPHQQFFSHVMARTSYFRLVDDDTLFIQDQHI